MLYHIISQVADLKLQKIECYDGKLNAKSTSMYFSNEELNEFLENFKRYLVDEIDDKKEKCSSEQLERFTEEYIKGFKLSYII